MKPQTDHNRRGHEKARALGFESDGLHLYGWRHASVYCVTCGHRLPWYHHSFQKKHRAGCLIRESE